MAIIQVEDALIAEIKSAAGNRVRGVESLPGDWDDDMLKRMLRFVPGVFVAFAGGNRSGGADALEAAVDGRWLVYVCTGHASGEAARRRGDAQAVGAYELLEVICPRLHGLVVPNVGSLSLLNVSNLYSGQVDRQGLAIYAIELSLPMTFSLSAPADLAPFEIFAAQYDVPPFSSDAEHRKWLAGDYSTSRPDAADTVTLPQT